MNAKNKKGKDDDDNSDTGSSDASKDSDYDSDDDSEDDSEDDEEEVDLTALTSGKITRDFWWVVCVCV